MRLLDPSSLPLLGIFSALSIAGACSGPDADVVVYVAVDQQHSEGILRRFEEGSGLRVRARFDTEASKTVGLVQALIEEADRPRCDVFWNNEMAQTVRLAQKGIFEPYRSPSAGDLPDRFRDAEGRYVGFAARARILIVNTELLPNPAERPTSMWDLIDPRWKGMCGVALPLTGTTLTHFTALRTVLPEDEFLRFASGLKANEVQLLQSNSAAMRAVAEGALVFAFTDTDDFSVAKSKGYPVAAVFPDQANGAIGTMLIPNTVSVVSGCPHPRAARRLVDYLVSREVEALLASSRSAQIPLRSGVPGPKDPEIRAYGTFKEMQWDPEEVARALEGSAEFFRREFGR